MSKKHKKQVGIVNNAKKLSYLFILDRSGSMQRVRAQTVNNVNEQLNAVRVASKKEGIEAAVTVLLFDSPNGPERSWFSYLFTDIPVDQVKDITEAQYVPDGGTPLRDAIGTGITDLQTRLGDKLGDPNIKVLVSIFTDGEENTSRTYSAAQIKTMIEHLSSDGKFVFTFIGAGTLDAVTRVSETLGVASTNTMAYENTQVGHTLASKKMCRSVGSFMTSYSSGLDTSANYFAPQNEALGEKIEGELMKNDPVLMAGMKKRLAKKVAKAAEEAKTK